MTSEKFCLRWDDFEKNISSAFRELRGEKDFFDVTLACENDQIYAHKVILSASSSFFHNILKRNPHQHPLLYLKGVKKVDLQSILNFMYHGEVNIAQDDLNSFLAVAEDLKVKGLTQGNSGTHRNTESVNDQQQHPRKQNPGDHNLTLKSDTFSTSSSKSNSPNRSHPSHPPPPDLTSAVAVKAEPRDYASTQHYQHAQLQSESEYQQTLTVATTNQQDMDYQVDSFDAFGQYEENQEFSDTLETTGSGTKVFVSQDKIGEYIQDQCLYQTDTTSGTKIWSCGVCQKYLNHKRDLMRHIESFHIETTPYTCSHCEAQFSTKRSVQRHTLAVHNTTYAR